MNDVNMERKQREEQNLLACDISDEEMEAAAYAGRVGENITWYHCPTGLTICRT
jgi:hypothetical protein